MDERILKGFCQKCDQPITFEEEENHTAYAGKDCINPIPVWFLSPNQMRIVLESKEFEKYWKENGFNHFGTLIYSPFHVAMLLSRALEEIPFLVAKILKDTGSSKDSPSKSVSFRDLGNWSNEYYMGGEKK